MGGHSDLVEWQSWPERGLIFGYEPVAGRCIAPAAPGGAVHLGRLLGFLSRVHKAWGNSKSVRRFVDRQIRSPGTARDESAGLAKRNFRGRVGRRPRNTYGFAAGR